MVYLEHSSGRLETASMEILGKARELADIINADVTGVILGNDDTDLADDAIHSGADCVLVANTPVLAQYTTEAFSNALGQIVRDQKPEILLLAATHNGRALAGRLAVRLNTGLTAHAVQVEIEQGTNLLVCGVPGYGGGILAMCKCPSSRPQMATICPGIFPVPEKRMERRGKIEKVEVDVGEIQTKVLERHVRSAVDVTRADIVIIAGKGAEDQLDAVRKLADSVSGVVGVTRPLADKGLMPRDHQVGSTGQAVSARVAIVLGASGATHFVSGIRRAKMIISVNKDPNASINSYADYFVVDDVEKVLPALLSIGLSRGGG
jgi:electron transfer flavoprotein alpha subunit